MVDEEEEEDSADKVKIIVEQSIPAPNAGSCGSPAAFSAAIIAPHLVKLLPNAAYHKPAVHASPCPLLLMFL